MEADAQHPQRTGERLLDLIREAQHLTVVAPFIKIDALKNVFDVLSPDASIRVYTRWRADEVAAGVSDLDVLDLVAERDGELLLHPLLHAKAYVTECVALAGSANVTGVGLGWSQRAGLELLFEVSTNDPALQSLMQLLELAASVATPDLRDEVAYRAQLLSDRVVIRDVDAEEDAGLRVESAFWVPRYNMPQTAWAAYQGRRSPRIQALVRQDLAALGVPGGIEREADFNAMVGAALSQGFTGRLIAECAGLSAVDAGAHFGRMLAEAGVEVAEGELGQRYRAFVEWVAHFVPGRELRATGFSLG